MRDLTCRKPETNDAHSRRLRNDLRLSAANSDDIHLNVDFTRVSDLVGRDDLVVDPPVPMAAYRDGFGNWCTRIVAPKPRSTCVTNVERSVIGKLL